MATDWTADISSRQLPLSAVLQVLILPVCALEEAKERGKRSRSAAPDKSQFWLQGEVNRKVNRVMAFSILCPAQQRVPEVSYQPFQTVATPPDCISHTVCLRQKGKDSCPSKWLPAALWLFLILGTRVAFLELLISFIIFPPRDYRVHWLVSSAISTLLQCLCPPLLQIHYICTTPLSYMWDAHRDAFCSQVNILSTSYLTALWCLALFLSPCHFWGYCCPCL